MKVAKFIFWSLVSLGAVWILDCAVWRSNMELIYRLLTCGLLFLEAVNGILDNLLKLLEGM